VSSSSAFRWLLAAVLLLSIAWKIAVPFDSEYEPKKNGVIDFFQHNHFVVTEQLVNGVPVIQAEAAACRLQTASLAPNGSNRELIRQLFMDADRFFVVFRGRVYPGQPILRTMIDNIWSQSLYDLGLIDKIMPIIAVAANASCDAERLPWDELRHVS
jgi:hypothetical protein